MIHFNLRRFVMMEDFELADRIARLDAEYQDWLNDAAAQEEYRLYLLERDLEEMHNEIGD
ncbi:MAG: hypothetical protein IM620_18720 [Cytophagales bacterium]|nr:hypothetical protein [Cytophagales bacterium]